VSAAREGLKLPPEQSGQVFRGEFSRLLGWEFFLGLRIWSGNSEVTRRSSGGTVHYAPTTRRPGPPDKSEALRFEVNREKTPNRFYPTTGTMLLALKEVAMLLLSPT
jgi:hypothetical protein